MGPHEPLTAKQRAVWIGAASLALVALVGVTMWALSASRAPDTQDRTATSGSTADLAAGPSVAGLDSTEVSGASAYGVGADSAGGGSSGDQDTGGSSAGGSSGGGSSGGKASGAPLPDSYSPPGGAVSFLEADGLTASQTYSARAAALGWQDAKAGTVCARITSPELLGPINAGTGEPMGAPVAGTPDHSKRLAKLTVLAATSERARKALTAQGDYTVYLVLVPSKDGAVFVIDKAVR